MKRLFRFRNLVNLVLVVALTGVIFKVSTDITTKPASAASGAVTTTTVKQGSVLSTVSASGNVQSANAYSLNFQTAGTLSEVDVAAGQTVTKGQVVAKLDQTAANDSLQAAQLNLSAAQDKLNTLESDSTSTTTTVASQAQGGNASSQSSTTVAPSDIVSAQAAVVSAQSQLYAAQQTLKQTVLTAPANGTITAVNGNVGDKESGSSSASSASTGSSATSSSGSSSGGSSSSSSAFMMMSDLTSFQVRVGFSEADATKIAVGDPATVTLTALPTTQFAGTVTELDLTSTTVSNVVTYYANVSLNNPTSNVKLGMTSTVAVTVAHADNVLYLPSAAVHQVGSSNNATVTLDDNGKQSPANVTIGLKGDSSTVITSGLTVGQTVVLSTGGNSTTGTGTAARTGTTGAGGLGGGLGTGGGGFGGAGGARVGG